MRNLKILLFKRISSDILLRSDIVICGKEKETNDLSEKLTDLFCLCNDVLYRLSWKKVEAEELYDFKTFFNDGNVPKAIKMWYRDLYDTVSVCFETGEIVSLVLNSGRVQNCESYLLDYNVKDICWSPDEEFAIVLFNDQKLSLLSSEFCNLAEINVFDSSSGEKELINVGWGKKETQFHGSEGKQAALQSRLPSEESSTDDSHAIKVTWRGDSCLFAVSYWSTKNNMRMVKVFNSDGILQCSSEEIPGMEETLFWKPQGNLITFTQRYRNKYLVGFMEKNGLKHGDFILPNNVKVKDLFWNETSTILCTLCVNTENQAEEIFLWTTGNYHWYLKQKFKLNSPSKQIWWDKGRPQRMYVFCSDGVLNVIEWVFSTNTSYNSSLEEKAYVAVIDGDNILMTSFTEAVVPPPMSSSKLLAPHSVNSVMFPPPGSDENMLLCAVLCNGSVALYENGKSEPLLFSDFLDDPALTGDIMSLAHWEWLNKNTFVFCLSKEKETHIYNLELDGSKLSLRSCSKMSGEVISCTRGSNKLVIQTCDGKLFSYHGDNMEVSKDEVCLPEPCPFVVTHSTGLYCLSELSRFYVNSLQIPSLCGIVTSFLLRDPFVILTTSSHKLLILKSNKSQLTEVSERKLERGSRLVTTTGNSVILQAPRGNLETIQPRALTVLAVGETIDAKHYREALYLLRKQRIDLNLLVDHNQSSFLSDIETFIDQVDPQWITLFITELSDDNVTKTSYSCYYTSEKRLQKTFNGDKCDRVCKYLISSMMKTNERKKKFLIPLLSALVKIGSMGAAIRLANDEQALQHLMFIVDVNKLYDEALGAYDLDAALKIANKSQKDPKEYVPYLNSLLALDPNYMKFTIDKGLNKFTSALSHLARCPEEHKAEAIQFVKDNSLYAPALKEFKIDPVRYKEVANLYGEYLYEKKHYEESGLMYLRGDNKEKAAQSFAKAGNWRQCMLIASKGGLSIEECSTILKTVCGVLESNKKYKEAGALVLEWSKDIDKAIGLYIEGRHWNEAIYTAEKHNKPDQLEIIKGALLEMVEALRDNLREKKDLMEAQAARLSIVRIEKQNKPAFIYDDFSDTASEASSKSSTRTKSSLSRSSKNTKKLKKKMLSLKEGNPREESGLISAICEGFHLVEKYIAEVNESCSALLYFDEDRLAGWLQADMAEWVRKLDHIKRVTWPKTQEISEIEVLDDKLKHPPDFKLLPDWEFQVLKK